MGFYQAQKIEKLEADKELAANYRDAFEMLANQARTIEKKHERIAELEAALKPFAELDAHWAGDKMPLQPKSVMLNPLPILYAIKALKND